MATLTKAGKSEFNSAVAEGLKLGTGIYGDAIHIGSVEPSWIESNDSAFFEDTIDGQDVKVWAPFNFDLTLSKVKLVIVTALRDNDKFGVVKGTRKLSVQ